MFLKLGCKILHSGHFWHCFTVVVVVGRKSGPAKAGPAGAAGTPLYSYLRVHTTYWLSKQMEAPSNCPWPHYVLAGCHSPRRRNEYQKYIHQKPIHWIVETRRIGLWRRQHQVSRAQRRESPLQKHFESPTVLRHIHICLCSVWWHCNDSSSAGRGKRG